MKQTVAVGVFMVVFAVCAAWGQGKLVMDGDSDDAHDGKPGVAIARSNPAAAGARPLKLVGAASSNEDFDIFPNDLNANEVHTAVSSVAVDIPADPARTYWFMCTGGFVFWSQAPSASPLLFNGDFRVRIDAFGGSFNEVFRFDGVREIDTSNREVDHNSTPGGCTGLDQSQLVGLFVAEGLTEADALAKAQQVLRSRAHLTVTFFARMQSVSEVDFSAPILQVWSD